MEKKKDFLKSFFHAFFFKRENLYNGVFYGMFLSLIFKCISTVCYFSLLELIRKIAESDASRHSMLIRTYFIFIVRYTLSKCFYNVLFSYFSENVRKALMKQRLRRVIQPDYTEIVKKSSNDVACSVQNSVEAYMRFFEMLLLKAPEALLFLFYLSYKLLTSSLVVFPILIIYIPLYFLIDIAKNKTIVMHNEAYNAQKEDNLSILFDKIQNFQLIKSFGIEKIQCKEIYEKLKCQRKSFLELKLCFHKKHLVIELISELPVILIILLSYYGFGAKMLNFSISFSIFGSLNRLLKDISLETLKFRLLVESFTNNSEFDKVQPNITFTVFENSIGFENVSLSHDDNLILGEMSIEIKKRQKIAIVGRNGTGKSTLIRALMKFSKYNGNISIDNQDIRSIANKALFELVSYVPQDDCIMSTTILDNIKMGNKNLSLLQVISKAQELNIHDDIMKLKNGYDTVLGQNGVELSASEKKKISLIRALIKDSPILLLDEATSTVDKTYENFLVKKVLKNLPSTTVIMIIHQQDLLCHFDKVIFLDNKHIEGFDHFDNLLIEKERFRNFIIENREKKIKIH
ncbi:hypothetical protein GINT2_000133 [Glugoides intestinalis]